jgi:hypothetical protein
MILFVVIAVCGCSGESSNQDTSTPNDTTPPAAQDTVPNAFAFTDQYDVSLANTMMSNAVTIAGVTAASPISVSGGDYEINASGNWVSGNSSIHNGDTVRVRHTSAASYSSEITTTLTIGGVSDVFASTTLPVPMVEVGDLRVQYPAADALLYDAIPYTIDPANTSHRANVANLVATQTAIPAQLGGGVYPGWTWAQSNEIGQLRYMYGYIYTTTASPGVNEEFPRGAGSRALVLYTSPTDFVSRYANDGDWQAQPNLRFGDADGQANALPNNFYIQYWMMVPYNAQQQSTLYQHQKHLYFCRGSFPCTADNYFGLGVRGFSANWSFFDGRRNGNPQYGQDYYLSSDARDSSLRMHIYWESSLKGTIYTDPNNYAALALGGVDLNFDSGWGENIRAGADPAIPAFPFMEYNKWYLVREHFDFRSAAQSGRAQVAGVDQGAYEQWIRARDGAFVKTAEWIGGVTPGFTYNLNFPNATNPIKVMEFTSQTTNSGLIATRWIAAYNAASGTTYPMDGSPFNPVHAATASQTITEKRWNYYQDICIADSADKLPVYGVAQ